VSAARSIPHNAGTRTRRHAGNLGARQILQRKPTNADWPSACLYPWSKSTAADSQHQATRPLERRAVEMQTVPTSQANFSSNHGAPAARELVFGNSDAASRPSKIQLPSSLSPKGVQRTDLAETDRHALQMLPTAIMTQRPEPQFRQPSWPTGVEQPGRG
jgi:hypothetical protein